MSALMGAACVMLVLAAPCSAFAQDQPAEPRDSGLPAAVSWTFNFDAGIGSFGFLNSLFTNPHDEPSGDLGDSWFEGYIKPSVTGEYPLGGHGTLVGTATMVGERTYGGAPALAGEDFSSFGPDDLSIGWRAGSLFEVTAGRARYELGHGMLLYDGAGEGGSRGAYWTNARKAFGVASIVRVTPAHHRIEAFYLDKDELPENDTRSRLWGGNYELHLGDTNVFGVTYMRWLADPQIDPGRNGLNVVNLRADATPFPSNPALAAEFEYARERNGDARDATAWTVKAGYAFEAAPWSPTLSYRYAFFEGDDPATPRNESFDPLFPGFSDWGTWWQGEIAGEYFLANSNLISHQLRAHLTPSARLDTGVLFYRFLADHAASYGDGVTSRDLAFEVNAYADWKVNPHFTVSLVGGFANPGKAVAQATGRTANFGLGLVSVAYHF